MITFGAERTNMVPKQEDISALIDAALKYPASFGIIYDRYVQRVYRYIYSRVGETREAEDITSQTFIAAYESLHHYRERGQFSAWLFRIARNKITDHFRSARGEVELEAAEHIAEREDALGNLIQEEEINQLRSLIQTLNSEERDLIHLRYVANLSFVEIAELLGKREDAVKKTLYRLLARLKSRMEES